MPEDRKGFTLLESVIALAVLSILIAAAAAPVSHMAAKSRLDRAAWEIQAKLNEARMHSIWEGVMTRIRFVDGSYTLEAFQPDSNTWKGRGRAFPEGVCVKANNTPIFLPTGAVSGLATILISNSRGSYKITLAITGRIKLARIS
jgi:prepilin-type N-terminal cleavage/methylation domain-containing protein